MNWCPDKLWMHIRVRADRKRDRYTQEPTEKKRTYIRGNHPAGHTEGETIKAPWL